MKKLANFSLTLFALLIVAACHTDDVEVTPPVVDEPETPVKLVTRSERMGLSGEVDTVWYHYNGTQFSRIVDNLGNERHFHYTGDNISRIDYYFEGLFAYTEEYLYNAQNRIQQIRKESGVNLTITQFNYSNETEGYFYATRTSNTGGNHHVTYEVENGIIIGRLEDNFYTKYILGTEMSPFAQVKGYDKIDFLFHDCFFINSRSIDSMLYSWDGGETFYEVSAYTETGNPTRIYYSDPLDGYFSINTYYFND